MDIFIKKPSPYWKNNSETRNLLPGHSWKLYWRIQTVAEGDIVQLRSFYNTLHIAVVTMESLGYLHDLASSINTRAALQKLPEPLKEKGRLKIGVKGRLRCIPQFPRMATCATTRQIVSQWPLTNCTKPWRRARTGDGKPPRRPFTKPPEQTENKPPERPSRFLGITTGNKSAD